MSSKPGAKWSVGRVGEGNIRVQVFTETGAIAATITFDQPAAEEFVDAFLQVVVAEADR